LSTTNVNKPIKGSKDVGVSLGSLQKQTNNYP